MKNRITRVNSAMYNELDDFIAEVDSLSEQELRMEDQMEKLDELETILERIADRGIDEEDMQVVVDIVNEEHQVFEKIDEAREKVDSLDSRLEEIEEKADRIMNQVGGLSPKRSYS